MNKICNNHGISYSSSEKCPLCLPIKQAKKTSSVNGNRRFVRVKQEDVAPRDQRLCQRCLRKYNKLRRATQCHHILNQANPKWEDYRYDPENLVMLCDDCHDITKRADMIDACDFPFETKLKHLITWKN